MTMLSIRLERVEVVTSVQRRRRWTNEQKLEIVKPTKELGTPFFFFSPAAWINCSPVASVPHSLFGKFFGCNL